MKEEINLATLAPYFADEDKARELLERLRWKGDVICPHCDHSEAYKINAKSSAKRKARKGLYKCKTVVSSLLSPLVRSLKSHAYR